MAKIYRVEHPDTGEGPYVSSQKIAFPEKWEEFWWISEIIREETGFDIGGSMIEPDMLHPTPCQDKGLSEMWENLRHRHEWVFGFESMESLISWFSDMPEVYEILAELGFQLRTYEGDMVRGHAQVLYKKESAKLLTSIPINEIEL